MKKYRTIWLSDIHMGTKDCKAKQLNSFLKQHRADDIYLVGDIIDGWRMKSGVYWTRDFTKVIRQLLKMSKTGSQIHYIIGNHDEFLRRFANHSLDNIHLKNRALHVTADGRRLLVIHGDQFDGVARCHRMLKHLGDKGYDLLMFLNRIYNRLSEKHGYGYWSLAGFLKSRISRAQSYVKEYEAEAAYSAKKQGYDGVVCGYIHQAASKRLNDIDYYNSGDWVESCTALVETQSGEIELIHWQDSAANDYDSEAYVLPASLAATITSQALQQSSLEPALEKLDEVDDLELGIDLSSIPALIFLTSNFNSFDEPQCS